MVTTRPSRCVSAEGTLPPALLASVQEYVESIYLWVPSRATERRRERDADILRRRAAGESIHQVALAMGLTARRICQIQKRARATSNGIAVVEEASR